MNVVEIQIPFEAAKIGAGPDRPERGISKMIKVFVVDDEKLVRRGIIGLIDWERFGYGDHWVIREAGEKQWNFWKREEVDLLFGSGNAGAFRDSLFFRR